MADQVRIDAKTHGIAERLEDARILYANGQREGALLMVLVAVAGTSRRRFPRHQVCSDGEAFKRFLQDELYKALQPRGVHVPQIMVACSAGTMPLEDILYHLVRCRLVHEALLDDDIEFEARSDISVTGGNPMKLTDGWIDVLAQTVLNAPENADLFPNRAATDESPD
ncbi:MAG: hypothetical protein AB7Y46_09815 [Armatimonadota bacterium]